MNLNSVDLKAKAEELRRLNAQLDEKKHEIEARAAETIRREEEKLQQFQTFPMHESNDEHKHGFVPNVEEDSQLSVAVEKEKIDSHLTVEEKKTLPPYISKSPSSPTVRRSSRASAIRHLEKTTIGVPEIDRVGAADELPPQAQIRIQKAKLRGIEEELRQSKKENIKLKENIKKLKEEKKRRKRDDDQIEKKWSDKVKIIRKKSSAKEKKLEKELERARRHIAKIEQELKEGRKERNQGASDGNAKDIRLNRALEELSRVKEERARMKKEEKEKDAAREREKKREEAEIKLLEKQRNELLAAFKKQGRLINVLKQQKMHIEAAKLLRFSEEEFEKIMGGDD
eukprot:g5820.t1